MLGDEAARQCSGAVFDIHGGGMDLPSSRTTKRDRAERRAVMGQASYANGCHNGFLNVDNEEDVEVASQTFHIRDVLKRLDGETLRFSCMRKHYRRPFNFRTSASTCACARSTPDTTLHTADASRQALDCRRGPRRFRAAITTFKHAAALAVLFDLAGEAIARAMRRLAPQIKPTAATLGFCSKRRKLAARRVVLERQPQDEMCARKGESRSAIFQKPIASR